eukprot:GEMP01041682.1.p1 GENE.GEMP01041682.1~~GEMP01041682.1.p1  ORF type:complete len:153 (+),score=29.74 GEMP01041682.1:122-580(+)
MFPYFFLFPFLLAASIGWPVLCSLHALQKKDVSEIKTWLVYWLLFIIVTSLLAIPGVESLVSLPFTIIGQILVDLYYEFQLAVIVLLVNPKTRYLDVVVVKVDALIAQHGDNASDDIKKYMKVGEQKLREGVTLLKNQVNKSKTKRTPAKGN